MTDPAAASPLPLILVELVLVMGGVLAFGIWQIRSTRRDRERAAAERARRAAELAAQDHSRSPSQLAPPWPKEVPPSPPPSPAPVASPPGPG